VIMSKGSNRRPSQVPHIHEATNWAMAFGEKWQAKDMEGNELAVGKTYEEARDKALATTPDDLTFSIIRVR